MSTTNKSNKTFGLSVWAINNRTIIYVLMGVFLLLGGTAYVTMPRENFLKFQKQPFLLVRPIPEIRLKISSALLLTP